MCIVLRGAFEYITYFFMVFLVWCEEVYLWYSPKFDTQQMKPFGTCLGATQKLLIKHCASYCFLLLFILRATFVSYQIRSPDRFSIQYALHIECGIWELKERENVTWRYYSRCYIKRIMQSFHHESIFYW